MSKTKPASAEKPYLREYFLEQRRLLCENEKRKDDLDTEIQIRLLLSREYRAADTVLLYMARRHEIATSMILNAAFANGKSVGLPVCTDEHQMIFRRIASVSDLVPGRYGIMEPNESCESINPDEKTLCVCPALSCDMRGYRLGFGGGYYDRFLNGFPGKKAALCYSDSIIPVIHSFDFDIPMDVVFTDSFTRYMK
ncbi:MAG: 5-formyltetrahydrofolate cyclo-ligase [Ruminococcus sp.]|uniref:5-formyltetrahydrofolate cyclo-ligase n=1 Tax=Ruminococcus sp. TaxID=41978 RepID=UPI00287393F3|nr:5-formyltetrahydrofolate cyclo-ligase [Ruminococcus sp.]MBQ3286009.1 5-formyltetrahydrofolate cyclo-ligase [Ruminococcus sp.]